MTDAVPAAAITAAAEALHADRCASESCRESGHAADQLLASVHMTGDQSADLHISRIVLEAAAPRIAAAVQEQMTAIWAAAAASPEVGQVIDDARAQGAAAERERWRVVLTGHYLMGINCDPDAHRDNPVCGCSRIHLGWHPSLGAARQAWIDHVASLLEDTP